MSNTTVKERIQALIEHFNHGSMAAFARMIGVKQQTLHRQFSEIDGGKLLLHFDRILQSHPEISRNWLYFGEGEMLGGSEYPSMESLLAENTDLKAQLAKAQAKVERLEQQLEAERNLSHELTRRLMLAGVVGADGGTEQKFPKAVQG